MVRRKNKSRASVANTISVNPTGPLPIVPFRPPVDPPSFMQVPPWRRIVQLNVATQPMSDYNLTLEGFLTATTGLSSYKLCYIKRVRVWGSTAGPASLTVSPLGRFAALSDMSNINTRPTVGYFINDYSGFEKDSLIAVVNSSKGGFLVEIAGVFM